jgi:hypothetical protein
MTPDPKTTRLADAAMTALGGLVRNAVPKPFGFVVVVHLPTDLDPDGALVMASGGQEETAEVLRRVLATLDTGGVVVVGETPQ